MLHLIYIFTFTIIAFLAISNLIKSLVTINSDTSGSYPGKSLSNRYTGNSASQVAIHPELLDDSGQPFNEPLLVMRSVNVEDARQQLDALYRSSSEDSIEVDEDN